jgi:DNA-binding response OmpR family regulator
MNILLVEDDVGIGRFVSRGLSAEGFSVQWARTGAEGEAQLASGSFAAAILDLGLPDMDGLQLCSTSRQKGVTTPILMLTARGDLEDKLDGFRHGADDYLSKPFAFAELLARLRVLSQRGRPTQTIVAGSLVLDRSTRTASVGERSATLPQREFEVLACLTENAGSAIARAHILERAWGLDTLVSDNALDVYIGYVRRRLARLPGAPKIQTIRGVGFRLAVAGVETARI